MATICQFRKTGVEETFFADVLEQHATFCRVRGIEPPSASTVAAVCARLGACRLLLIEPGENDVYVTFRLNFHHFDRLELDLRGHIHVRGAAFSCLRLKLAYIVLI